MKLYFMGKTGDGYGWGTCNTNLRRELSKLCDVVEPEDWQTRFDAPVFTPIPSNDVSPVRNFEAPAVFGYCFIESPLPPCAIENSKFFTWIFTGSDWNTRRLKEAGIEHCSTLHQGIDPKVFHPQPWPEMKGFRVFSGGKLEFRKGQDYVIAAVGHFMRAHSDVFLLKSWHNPWPQTAETMRNSWLVDASKPFEGLPMERVINVPAVPNVSTPAIYAASHVGLFPNRCEAGTNLVMMEYMACGRPVIASDATGQSDVLQGEGPLKLTTGDYDPAGWFNPVVSDIITHLEHLYANPQELASRGEACSELIRPWTWESCARALWSRVQEVLKQRGL